MENNKTPYELKMDNLIASAKELFKNRSHTDEYAVQEILEKNNFMELRTNELRRKDIMMAVEIAKESLYPVNDRVKKELALMANSK